MIATPAAKLPYASLVTSTDPCINTDDSIDMQDGTSLCDSESKTDSDDSDLEEANGNSQVETVEKPTSQGPISPEQIRLFLQNTYRKRNINLTEYFPDLPSFLECAQAIVRKSDLFGFHQAYCHRLKKLISKAKRDSNQQSHF